MFKNFGKVFKFTFRNQASTRSYKMLTIILGVILFLIPVGILFFMSMDADNEKDKKLESCGADKVYIANTIADGTNFDVMKTLDGDGYANITYITTSSVDEALKMVKDAGEKKSLVVEVTKDENEKISTRIVLPEGTEIQKSDAKNLNKAIQKAGMMFVVAARGVTLEDLAEVTKTTEPVLYNASGWASNTSFEDDDVKKQEQSNEKILEGFGLAITLLVCLAMYFVVLAYGASISRNVVMEKSSKLMDTLLISVKPEALVLGKLLGVLSAGLLQFFFWIAMLVGGVFAGVKIADMVFPDANSPVVVFLKSFGSLKLFQPVPVILAIIVLIFGILLYSAMAAFAGAVSSTIEQAASNQSIFLLILIASYFLVIMKGVNAADTPAWMYLVPFTAALTLPAGLVLGTVSTGLAVAGVLIIVLLALALVAVAGYVYKALALYKGESGGLGKAMKALAAGSGK